jgi:pyruvate/2-oxoglutarate dehydrogenase complex dihydrolipoamide acyltransferase (E2) component
MSSPQNLSEIPVVLPDLGVAPVRMSAWLADVGEVVYEGDRLVEVRVAGATFDVAAPATGRLTAQHVASRDELSPGQVLGVVAVEQRVE